MKWVTWTALALLLAAAIFTYHSMRPGAAPGAGGAPEPNEGAGTAKAPARDVVAELEALVAAGRPGAATMLADTLVYMPAERAEKLRSYWKATGVVATTQGLLPVLKRFRAEVLDQVTRDLSTATTAPRALHLAQLLYGDPGPDGPRLARCFGMNARRAVAALLVHGIDNPYDQAAVSMRARALEFVRRFRLREAAANVETMGATESFLPSRTRAREVWEELVGRKWPPKSDGNAASRGGERTRFDPQLGRAAAKGPRPGR